MIFISHNKRDRDTARNLALSLVAENLSIWYDEWEITAGDSIIAQINAGLASCTHFLIIWSRNAAKSHWVRRELSSTLARSIQIGTPRLIPILLDRTPLPELLADIKAIRYQDGREEDRRDLIRAVTGRNPSADLIRAVVRKYHEVIRCPQKADTARLKACPKCGSDSIEAWEDFEVNQEWADGQIMESPTFIPAVRCLECGWSRRLYDIDPESGV
ncbi:MAG: toll/interleukin-1 receptor domain-containing protein [Thermodesulfovibrionales bacterium]|nr:toll/interleukin-1 receptor domain-containing protein [Thermodesulfovibrionales bacterium]